MSSVVETARRATEAASHGKTPGPYLSLSQAEDEANSIATAFERVQPPARHLHTLRTDLVEVFTSAAPRSRSFAGRVPRAPGEGGRRP
jgi:hypothetical protein